MDTNGEVVSLYLDDIIPNRFQPREVFDEQALKELAVSIKEHGVIQPIIVRKVENKYEIIAGERRYKASTMAGLTKIPAIIRNLDDKECSKVALIENLQRKDLTPIEEARTYQKILELESGSMTQEQLAATMGKTQSAVSNKLRLLALPDEIQDALLKEKISERHARSLLNVEDKNTQIKLLNKIISEKMTVRDLEKEIKELKGGPSVSEGGFTFNLADLGKTSKAVSTEAPKAASFGNGSWTLQDNSADVKDDKSENSSFGFSTNLGDNKEENKEQSNGDFKFNFASFGDDSKRPNKQESTSIESKTDEKNTNGFNFVPSFSFGSSNTSSNESVKESETINLFGSKSDNIASNIQSSSISVSGKDYNKAITDVKEVVKKLELDGFKVSFDEQDEASNYKITITLNKE